MKSDTTSLRPNHPQKGRSTTLLKFCSDGWLVKMPGNRLSAEENTLLNIVARKVLHLVIQQLY
jgi:hypothetical protein